MKSFQAIGLLLEKNQVFAVPAHYMESFDIAKMIIDTPESIVKERKSVFLNYAEAVGEVMHCYLQKTQFSTLEGLAGPVKNKNKPKWGFSSQLYPITSQI